MLSCPLLPPSWSSLPPLAFTLQAGSGMSGPQLRGWHTAVPTALWDRAYGGSGGQRTGAPCTKQHPLPLCLPCGWCRSSPGHQGTAGDTETCPSFLPIAPQAHPVLSCGGGCIAQLVLTPGFHPHITPQQPSVPRGPGQREVMDLPQQPGQVLEESKSWHQPGV